MLVRRGIGRAILGLSGGIDSALVAYLCARALGPENVYAIRMPYRTSSPSSLDDAQRVVDALGINVETIDITDAVDGYLKHAPDADPRRKGNVMARMRMLVLFDQSARRNALPVGTGNKTERLMGYFTWHADDTPPVNPIGDLYKTQVWALARHLGVPKEVVDKPPSADLEANQTDETRPRHHVRASRPHPEPDPAGLRRRRDRRARLRAARRYAWCAAASTRPTGNATSRRPRWSRARRSTSSTCGRWTSENWSDRLVRMTQARTRTVGAYEAKTHLADLLDDVQRGVAVTITRRGKAVARLVPVDEKIEGRQDAIDRWLAVRHRVRPLGLTMKAAVNVGRKR